MKCVRAVIVPTKIIMLLRVPRGVVAIRGLAVAAICLMKSAWIAPLIDMPTPIPTRKAIGYRYIQ